MATARRKLESELVCYLIAWIPQAVWGGKPIDPDAINPYKRADKSPAMLELEAWQARRKWQILFTPPSKR